jgi:hypothetical protein
MVRRAAPARLAGAVVAEEEVEVAVAGPVGLAAVAARVVAVAAFKVVA